MGNSLIRYSTELINGDRIEPSPYQVHTDYQEWEIDDEIQEISNSYIIQFIVIPQKTSKNENKDEDVDDSDKDESDNEVGITLSIAPNKRDPFKKISELMTNDQNFFLSKILLDSKYSNLPIDCKFKLHISHKNPKYDTDTTITIEGNKESKPKDKLYDSTFSYENAKKICGKELILEKIPSGSSKNLKNFNNIEIVLSNKDLGTKDNYFMNHGGYGWKMNTIIPSMLYQRREDFNKTYNADNCEYDLNLYKTKTDNIITIHLETLKLIKKYLEDNYTSRYTYIDIYKPKEKESKTIWKSTIELMIDDEHKKKIWETYKKNKEPFTVQISIKIIGLISQKNIISDEHFPISIADKKKVL